MTITSKRILVLGVGALGSTIAELLARGGATNMMVVDADRIEVGNLVRHTLTLPHVGKPKATALASRLNACSPHAEVVAIKSGFPPADAPQRRLLSESDIVLDCTASDEVLHHMQVFPWEGMKLFVSVSIGYRAHRLYLFAHVGDSFPRDVFYEMAGPWLLLERKETRGAEMPWEGTGCWHPVFPASADDIWLMASVAAKYLERLAESPPAEAELMVFEQVIKDNVFMGLRRALLE
jgi:hypothetical protein